MAKETKEIKKVTKTAAKSPVAVKAVKVVEAKATKVVKAVKVVEAKATKVVKATKAITVQAIRYHPFESHWNVYFRLAAVKGVTVADLEKVIVSLARLGSGCEYSVNRMHEHDHHAPPFHMKADDVDLTATPFSKYGGEEAAEAYLQRVFDEIKAKTVAALPGVAVNFEKKPWTTEEPAVPGDNEN